MALRPIPNKYHMSSIGLVHSSEPCIASQSSLERSAYSRERRRQHGFSRMSRSGLIPPDVIAELPGPIQELVSKLHEVSERQMRSPRFRLHILQRRLRAWLGTGPIDWDEPRLRGYLQDKLVGDRKSTRLNSSH